MYISNEEIREDIIKRAKHILAMQHSTQQQK